MDNLVFLPQVLKAPEQTTNPLGFEFESPWTKKNNLSFNLDKTLVVNKKKNEIIIKQKKKI